MERFLATAPVRALSGTPAAAYSVGQRLKRGGKRRIEYGYVVHVAAGGSSADAGRITVLWMRGSSLAPQNAVVTCEGKAGMEQLQNWDKNYKAACTKNGNRSPPQYVSYDMLVDAWYARHPCAGSRASHCTAVCTGCSEAREGTWHPREGSEARSAGTWPLRGCSEAHMGTWRSCAGGGACGTAAAAHAIPLP
eukprot:COSAG02_NODE_17090_length_1029_cov_1.743011_1_plen_193_part_00